MKAGPKIEIRANGPGDCATVAFLDESHTMGNAIRYVLARSKKTDFVGYSIPHPSENKLNLRLQTKGGALVRDVLDDGLTLLKDMCSHVLETFIQKEKEFDPSLMTDENKGEIDLTKMEIENEEEDEEE